MRKIYSAKEVWASVKDAHQIEVFLSRGGDLITFILDEKQPLVSQKGLQVFPIPNPKSKDKGYAVYKNFVPNMQHSKKPYYLFDVKFPYEIVVKTKNDLFFTIAGPGVANVYFAIIYAQKGLLPSDCVPGGKVGSPAGFSRTLIENEEDYNSVMGRWAEYAYGFDPSRKFVPVVDEDEITQGYKVVADEAKCEKCSRLEKGLVKSFGTEPYKRFVASALKKSSIARLCSKKGDSKETLYKMYKEVWIPGLAEEAYTGDPMYKAMLEIEK